MWYWIDTGWGCGGIEVEDEKVIGGAPIFRKFIGQRIDKLQRSYKTKKLMNYDYILVDGNYYARRMFSVHKNLYYKTDGVKYYTGLAHGFISQLCNLKRDYEGKVIVVWDSGIDRRKKIDASYKQKRREKIIKDPKKDEENRLYFKHLKFLKWILKFVPVKEMWAPGEEGDDILNTLCQRLQGNKLVASNDHDMYQVISETTHLLMAKGGNDKIYGNKRFFDKFGIRSSNYKWVMALTGCRGDGVDGVPGIGNKTAIQIVKDHPDFVPTLVGLNKEMNIMDWYPELDKKGVVTVDSKHFKVGDKPGKRFMSIFENAKIAFKTYDLTRLYDVWPLVTTWYKDEDLLELYFETYGLHDLAAKLRVIKSLDK